MPAGGETLIEGEYTATWNSVALGIFEGDQGVPVIEQTTEGEDIGNTSKYGKTLIDTIYQGGNWRATFTCMEYKAGSIAAFWPFGTLGLLGVVGRLYYGMSAALVLTAVAGTPAASTPATLTASKAILAKGYNTKLLYGPTLRKVPIQQQLYLYDTGAGAYGWFTST